MPAQAQSIEQLRSMTITELANLEVSSVSKTEQSLAAAPAAIFVITHDMIVRSGATTIPEMLRLAPNLQVYRKASTDYVVTARGLNGNSQAQNFSNKLLVLIDGRSVYSPLYSGVYWDVQDVLPQDIERIEVISGPGATLWGANAMNGVINIITRDAALSQGLSVAVQGGSQEQAAGLGIGGASGETLSWRFGLHANRGDDTLLQSGAAAGDEWRRVQGGLRVDWTPGAADTVMLQAGLHEVSVGTAAARQQQAWGAHFLANWAHEAENGNALQLKTYVDYTGRVDPRSGARLDLTAFDLDLQHRLSLGETGRIVWGGNLRLSRYRIRGGGGLDFDPPRRTLLLASLFAQSTFSLTPSLDLIGGIKLENDAYSGVSLLPDLRLSWRLTDGAMLWGAVSHAVRSPTPFDVDVRETMDGILIVRGNPDFRTEKLTAFELGGRFQPSDIVSFSVSGYYNSYDDLRSIEFSQGALPLIWGNGLKGENYGVEFWGSYNPLPWWTLSAGLNLMRQDYRFVPESDALFGISQLGSDPKAQASLRSSMSIGNLTLDANLRHMGPLPDPYLPAHSDLDARLGYRIGQGLELSLSGTNLLHDRRRQYPGANLIVRQVQLALAWTL